MIRMPLARNDSDDLRVQLRFKDSGMNRRTHLHRLRRLLMLIQRGFVMRRRLEDLRHHAFAQSINGVILSRWHVEVDVLVENAHSVGGLANALALEMKPSLSARIMLATFVDTSRKF